MFLRREDFCTFLKVEIIFSFFSYIFFCFNETELFEFEEEFLFCKGEVIFLFYWNFKFIMLEKDKRSALIKI